MTTTLPDIVPTGYAGTTADFLIAKVDRSGAVRRQYFTVSIPTGTVTGKYVGLVPLNKGARLDLRGLYIENVGDGSFTFDLGFLYYDSADGSTDDDMFASALTTGQAGGIITLDEHAWVDFQAAGNGWVTLKTGGSTTDNTGVIKGHALISYDN